MFGLWEQFSLPAGIATLPVTLWEFSLGVYLVRLQALADHSRHDRFKHRARLPERRLTVGSWTSWLDVRSVFG